MSKNIINFIIFNGITTSVLTYILNVVFYRKSQIKIDHLYKKINVLEKTIDELKEYIEEIEYKIDMKNNKVINSHTELSSKLENFINSNYDVYD